MNIEDVTLKDIGRLMGVMFLEGVGFNGDILLTRIQMGLAFWMTPGFIPFYELFA